MKSRGYTMVEVMMALAVLAMGASGVIAMQKATILSNVNARNLATANGIAQSWMERMRADALAWNQPGSFAKTKWLGLAGTGQLGSGWFMPSASVVGTTFPAGSPSGDVLGADVFSYPAIDPFTPAFCTQARLTVFDAGTVPTNALYALGRVIRVEIRVFWARNGQELDCANVLPNPPAANAPTFDAATGYYGSVYLVSAVLQNSAPL